MDLESAIKHCEEVADEKEEDAFIYHNFATYNQNLYEKGLAENTEKECRACAEEHRQLAEWLTELKFYKMAFGKIEERVLGIVCYKGRIFKSFDDDLVLKTQDKNGMCSFYGFREVDV